MFRSGSTFFYVS